MTEARSDDNAGLNEQIGSERLLKLCLRVVAGGLLANFVFNVIMKLQGAHFPYTWMMFHPLDRWGDFFKSAFALLPGPLHQPVFAWPTQSQVDFLLKFSRTLNKTDFNPYHQPPVPMIMMICFGRLFTVLDPMLVFFATSAAVLATFHTVMVKALPPPFRDLRWGGVGLVSYPALFMIDRGHIYSAICAIALIAGTMRLVLERRADWKTVLLLALACNFRPNVVILPVLLVLGNKAGRVRDLVALCIAGTGLFAVAMVVAHALYPAYGLTAWLNGLADYRRIYIDAAVDFGWTSSLPTALAAMFGASSIWRPICLAIAICVGSAVVVLSRMGLLDAAEVAFAALAIMVTATPALVDYHLLAFFLPLLIVAAKGGAASVGQWGVVAGCLLLLVPKNYAFGSDDLFHPWSWQIVLNPMAALGVTLALIGLALRRHGTAIAVSSRTVAPV